MFYSVWKFEEHFKKTDLSNFPFYLSKYFTPSYKYEPHAWSENSEDGQICEKKILFVGTLNVKRASSTKSQQWNTSQRFLWPAGEKWSESNLVILVLQ